MFPAHPTLETTHGESQDTHSLYYLADGEDQTPIIPVGHVTSWQTEKERGQKLGEPYETEVERTAGESVYLPAHGHR